MTKNHDLEPTSSSFGDCSNCELAGELIGYLDYESAAETSSDESEGHQVVDFRLDVKKLRALRRILEISPDLAAFVTEMKALGICPLSMVENENVEIVKAMVPIRACVSFDLVYRPGVQIDQE